MDCMRRGPKSPYPGVPSFALSDTDYYSSEGKEKTWDHLVQLSKSQRKNGGPEVDRDFSKIAGEE